LTENAVLIFARSPELGKVKTRLESAIGDYLTLAIYRAFLRDTLTAARESGARVILAHTPGPPFTEQALADDTFVQRGNTFGERFDFAVEETAKRLSSQTPFILIGADTPHLSPTFLHEALMALTHYDAVIGPNLNGGFYLLGFSRPPVRVQEVFHHDATDEVAVLSLILAKARMKTSLLEPNFDIDLPEDLHNLIRIIDRANTTGECWIPANTRRVLQTSPVVSLAVKRVSTRARQRLAAQLKASGEPI